MAEETRRGIKEGIGFGLIAGVIFAIVEVVAAGAMGDPPLMPLRMFASVILGQAALETFSVATAVVVGGITHLVLSAIFGLIYGLINSRLSAETQTGWAWQSGLGLVFGAAIWLVNFQVIARLLYPWFLTTPQFLQMLMHAMFFGLPLGLMYAAAERRAHGAQLAHGPA